MASSRVSSASEALSESTPAARYTVKLVTTLALFSFRAVV